MERGLQKTNHYNQLAEWVQRVETCRKSGQKVSEWCLEHVFDMVLTFHLLITFGNPIDRQDFLCYYKLNLILMRLVAARWRASMLAAGTA